jgi:hypothetical protein
MMFPMIYGDNLRPPPKVWDPPEIRKCKKCGRHFTISPQQEEQIKKYRMQYPQKCEKCRKG